MTLVSLAEALAAEAEKKSGASAKATAAGRPLNREPASVDRARGQAEAATRCEVELDANLPEDLVDRVLTALRAEQDPEAVDALIAELGPNYPLAAGVLEELASRLRQGDSHREPK